jgi:hypothetical protein
MHAVSDQNSSSSTTPYIKKHHIQTGFVEQEFYSVGNETLLVKQPEETAVNEGMIELLTEYVLREYVRRVGGFEEAGAEDVDRYFEVGKSNKVRPYLKEVEAAREMITKLTNIAGVPEQQIKEAMLYGLLHEGKVLTEELELLFIELGHESEYRDMEKWFVGEIGMKDVA